MLFACITGSTCLMAALLRPSRSSALRRALFTFCHTHCVCFEGLCFLSAIHTVRVADMVLLAAQCAPRACRRGLYSVVLLALPQLGVCNLLRRHLHAYALFQGPHSGATLCGTNALLALLVAPVTPGRDDAHNQPKSQETSVESAHQLWHALLLA